MKWIPVAKQKPPRSKFAIPVLIYPRRGSLTEQDGYAIDGFCYYGTRVTGKRTFYLFGAEIPGVTHWMPLPKPPKKGI